MSSSSCRERNTELRETEIPIQIPIPGSKVFPYSDHHLQIGDLFSFRFRNSISDSNLFPGTINFQVFLLNTKFRCSSSL